MADAAPEPASVLTTRPPAAPPRSPLSDEDLWLFGEGRHLRLYQKMGAQPSQDPARPGTHFAVWAPQRPASFGDRGVERLETPASTRSPSGG